MRIFTAFSISQTVQNEVRKIQTSIQSQKIKLPLRFSSPKQIHVTLEFLGEITGGADGDN